MNGLVIGSDFCPTITVNNTSGVESTGLQLDSLTTFTSRSILFTLLFSSTMTLDDVEVELRAWRFGERRLMANMVKNKTTEM